MSEYQYYEFQSIDRPLTQEERAAISQLSSRARPTANRVTFTYSYSDLPGDPKTILAKYFDIMYYIANWGTQQLMFRFPKSAISSEEIAPYCVNNCISLFYVKDWAILNWEFNREEGFEDWIEGEGTLAELIGLRQEILLSDYRGLYLAWLKAITLSEEYVDINKKQIEPPLPPGLAQLSPSQKAFTEIFAVNKHLLSVAATPSTKPIVISDELFQQAIAQLSSSECQDFLLKLVKGESNLSVQLKRRLLEIVEYRKKSKQTGRTIGQLLEEAFKEEKKAERILKEQAEDQRIQELHNLAKREVQAWEEVDLLLEKPQAKTYDQCVKLLIKLRDLAIYQNRYSAFQEKINQIYQKYSRRTSLIKRLRDAGL